MQLEVPTREDGAQMEPNHLGTVAIREDALKRPFTIRAVDGHNLKCARGVRAAPTRRDHTKRAIGTNV